MMNADGSNPTRLTQNRDFNAFPAWSPDGTKIAFWSNRNNSSDIYVMNADGSNPTRLTYHDVWDDLWAPRYGLLMERKSPFTLIWVAVPIFM